MTRLRNSSAAQVEQGAPGRDAPGTPPVGPSVASPTYDFSKEARKHRLERKIYAEANVSGFSHLDQEVAFFTQVAALLRPTSVVLDFGAGRGEFIEKDPSTHRVWLQNLRGRCAHVDGCDPDPIVLGNPTLDSAVVIQPGKPLPYDNGRFDLIVARYVFEHISDPKWAAAELLRVLKPGGWICAMTPNRWGYVALASRLVPNFMHPRALSRVQPGRNSKDIFPTVYKLNRPSAVKRYFGYAAEVYHYSTSAVPSYNFGSLAVMRLQQLLHRLTPPMFDVGLRFFIHKRSVVENGAPEN